MKANLNFNRRQWLAATFGFLTTSIASPILAQTRIRRIRTQYIAALGAEGATSGTGAETWGLFSSEHAANKPTNLKQIKFSNSIS
ncbi:hypothetical protein OAL91_00885 [bacterium]|nr:hypothetical protein [bacterium]